MPLPHLSRLSCENAFSRCLLALPKGGMGFMRSCRFATQVFSRDGKNSLRMLGASLCLLLMAMSASSQVNLGRIFGTITDQSAGVINGASVVVTDVARNVSRTLMTDSAGEYSAPSLTPGTYTVQVTFQGFRTARRENVVVGVGQDIRVDIAMQPGEQTQAITVTESVPVVDATNATLGGTISNVDINELPLNGRDFQTLINLRPGVATYPGGGAWTQSTNGLRPDMTTYMVDGLFSSDPYGAGSVINGNSAINETSTVLPLDAIQEFNVEENPKAEFGWRGGAVVNVGIKSGTNNIHGTAYAFGRSAGLDARDFFNYGPSTEPAFCSANATNALICQKLPTQLEQFGATAGGAIKKDKLFYFLGYEGFRSSIGNVFGLTIPETCNRAASTACGPVDTTNNIADAESALTSAGIPISPASQKVLGLYPANNGGSNGQTFGFPNSNTSDNGVAKIDYHLNDKNTISGFLFIGFYYGLGEAQPVPNPDFLVQLPNKAWVGDGSWIYTPNSSWVNEARFGYNRSGGNLFPVDISSPASALGLNTGVTKTGGLPFIGIAGFTPLGSFFNNIQYPSWLYNALDNVSYLHGKHAFKFGFEFANNGWTVSHLAPAAGQIQFLGSVAFPGSSPLEDFLAGDVSNAFLLSGNPQRNVRDWLSAAFIQDDWRVTPRLTVNLGLRYEYFAPLGEANNLLGNFDPAVGLVQLGKQISSLVNPDYKDFEPRLGIAWDPTGTGKTAVRVGGSLLRDHPPLALFTGFLPPQNANTGGLGAIPTGFVGVTPGGGTIATGLVSVPVTPAEWNTQVFNPTAIATPSCGVAPGTQCNINAVDPNWIYPYVFNWTIGIQHSVTPNTGIQVAYVGNHADHLPLLRDINQINPATGLGAYSTAFPYLGFINYLSTTGVSNYNALQVTLDQKLYHGLTALIGYTYGHGLDHGSQAEFAELPQNSLDPRADYASSDYDQRHRVTATLTYALPSKKSPLQLLQGWSVNSLVTIMSGQPWTVDDYSDNFSLTNELADRWDFFGNPADFTVGPQGIPHCSGTFETPGTVTCDQFPLYGIGSPIPFSASQTAAAQQNCLSHAPSTATLDRAGCFIEGRSVMVPPALGQFGTMGRNIFRGPGFAQWDFSATKEFKFGEKVTAQFRAEFFNILNHPIFANPLGAGNGFGFSGPIDPANVGSTGFGCACATPDVAAGNPIVGSGGARDIQLGLKITY